MARLLTDRDYLRVIQADNLLQIIQDSNQVKLDSEQAAQSEMIGYLTQRYKTNEIFTNTSVFDVTDEYFAKNLVYLDATEYTQITTYVTDDLCLHDGKVYISDAGNLPQIFDPSQWTLLGNQYDYFYVKLPATEFDLDATYAINDEVWYEDHLYTCIVACTGILPTEAGYWTDDGEYSIAGELVTDNTFWTAGDNRNQLIVLHLINITLYWLHHRINPRNVPEHRRIAYDGNGDIKNAGSALNWLKMCASGDVNADLPEIQPLTGMSVRYGSSNNSDTMSRNSLW